jgi:hypothetical protein
MKQQASGLSEYDGTLYSEDWRLSQPTQEGSSLGDPSWAQITDKK